MTLESVMGFPGGASDKNLPADAGDKREAGSIPGWGRSPGGGPGNLLQYSYLENPMDRRACWSTVHAVAKSQTRLKRLSKCAQSLLYRVKSEREKQTSCVDAYIWNLKKKWY